MWYEANGVREAITHGIWVPRKEEERLYKKVMESEYIREAFLRFCEKVQLSMCSAHREEQNG